MTLLIILGSLLLLIIGIMLLRIRITIEADTTARVYLKILFFRIKLFPKEKKPPKLKHYTPKKIAKREAKKRKKAEAKFNKKLKKKQKKQQEKEKASEEKKRMTLSDITELISLVLSLVKTFFLKLGKHLRLDLTKIHITVASDNAAKTALEYGAITNGVSALCDLLESSLKVKPKGTKDIIVSVDFLSEKPTIDIVASASLRVWQIFNIAFAVIIELVKKKILDK